MNVDRSIEVPRDPILQNLVAQPIDNVSPPYFFLEFDVPFFPTVGLPDPVDPQTPFLKLRSEMKGFLWIS